MDQTQPPAQPSNQQPAATSTPPAQAPTPGSPLPYKTGDGSYNRESGKKTLAFVGVIIALIAVLSISSLLMINRKSSVMIQSETAQPTSYPSATTIPIVSPTVAPVSTEEGELDSIQIDSSDTEIKNIEQETYKLF